MYDSLSLWKKKYTEKMTVASTRRFVNIASAKQIVVVTISIVTTTIWSVTTTTTVVAVTRKIVTATILVCWGYINKTFCWGNKAIFSVIVSFSWKWDSKFLSFWDSVFGSLFLKINPWTAISMKKSRQELSIDVVIHGGIFKSNQITLFPPNLCT